MTKQSNIKEPLSPSRRDFMRGSATILGGTILGSLPIELSAYAGANDTLKVALIGCGSRGAGAAVNALKTKGNVRLVAMADVFRDKLDEAYDNITKIPELKGSVQVPEKHKFVGFEGYKQAIALADVVLLVTPAPFRPLHFEEAVKAGKHVFMEKPLASDAPGIRQVLATGEEAKKKNLKVLVGLQNRYDPDIETIITQVQNGVIGDIVSSTDYYLIGPVKHVPRQPGQSEMEFQLRNWRHFNWLWAGAPAGLQIHNTDLVNWAKGSYPVRAQGMGGRCALTGSEYGDTFDHYFIEYEYADGMKLNSQIRSVSGTWNKGGANFIGTKGTADVSGGIIKDLSGKAIWRKSRDSQSGNPYQIEHDKFFAAIRNNTPMNDTEWGALSTMTTIMGRMAAHSGKMITWEEALKSELSILPKQFSWDAAPPVKPDANGHYPIPVPGQTQVM
jgi:myo-inositol 2-dehydrogenase / D-chiro-inositol 1-dehydrogenase